MTMKNITLSVLAAGMLLGTNLVARDAMPGSLEIAGAINEPDGVTDKLTISTELLNAIASGAQSADGIITLDINNIDTNNDGNASHLIFKVVADGSGTVSDPAFIYHFPGDVTDTFTVGDDIIDEWDDNTSEVIPAAVATLLDATFDADSNTTTLRFQGNSSTDVYTNRYYIIASADNTPKVIDTPINNALINTEITVDLYSTSGTEELVSFANITPFEAKPQYAFNCDAKLDGLINFESNSLSFVPTHHGVDFAPEWNGSAYRIDVDSFIFTVTNNVLVNDIEYTIDGNGTVVRLYATATSNDTNYTNLFTALENGGLTLTQVNTGEVVGDANTTTDDNASTPNLIEFKFNQTIPAGSTRYTASLTTDLSASLLPTDWTAEVLLDDTAVFTPSTTRPYPDANPGAQDVGEWKDYTYIAQIGGATNTDVTQTKLFITNRSCKTVTPTVKFIMDGKTVDVEAAPIAVNNQAKIVLDDLINANTAAFAAAGVPTSGRYAVEIIIPGTAEDFYVYAQAQSRTDIAATKDLPVYNTSTRSN